MDVFVKMPGSWCFCVSATQHISEVSYWSVLTSSTAGGQIWIRDFNGRERQIGLPASSECTWRRSWLSLFFYSTFVNILWQQWTNIPFVNLQQRLLRWSKFFQLQESLQQNMFCSLIFTPDALPDNPLIFFFEVRAECSTSAPQATQKTFLKGCKLVCWSSKRDVSQLIFVLCLCFRPLDEGWSEFEGF